MNCASAGVAPNAMLSAVSSDKTELYFLAVDDGLVYRRVPPAGFYSKGSSIFGAADQFKMEGLKRSCRRLKTDEPNRDAYASMKPGS